MLSTVPPETISPNNDKRPSLLRNLSRSRSFTYKIVHLLKYISKFAS